VRSYPGLQCEGRDDEVDGGVIEVGCERAADGEYSDALKKIAHAMQRNDRAFR
jgi:hypothetical protein